MEYEKLRRAVEARQPKAPQPVHALFLVRPSTKWIRMALMLQDSTIPNLNKISGLNILSAFSVAG